MNAIAQATSDAGLPSGGLDAQGLRLRYGATTVLDIDQLSVLPGDAVGIVGPSGSGKTSLLYVLSGIARADAGVVAWDGKDIRALSEADRDRWRRHQVGFIFQDFHLVPGLSVIDNVLLPLSFDRWRPTPAEREAARLLLERLGAPTERSSVMSLSRGEQQRVALARALVRRPRILIADEPTASLDSESAATVVELLLQAVRAFNVTLLAVSHDRTLIDRLQVVHRLENGRICDTQRLLALY